MPEPNWACAAGCNTVASPMASAVTINFFIESSLKGLWNGVIGVRRQKQVLRKIHFHAMALPNRDGGRYLHEAVKNAGRGLRNTGRSSIGERLRAAGGDGAAALRDLAGSGNHSQGDRGAEDFLVVVVDLVFQSFFADLVEAVELVEIDGVTIGHNQAVKCDSHPSLLAEARRSNLLRFAQRHRSFGDDDVLTVVRIQGI